MTYHPRLNITGANYLQMIVKYMNSVSSPSVPAGTKAEAKRTQYLMQHLIQHCCIQCCVRLAILFLVLQHHPTMLRQASDKTNMFILLDACYNIVVLWQMLRLGGQTKATCWIDVGSNVASNVAFVWPPLNNRYIRSMFRYCPVVDVVWKNYEWWNK